MEPAQGHPDTECVRVDVVEEFPAVALPGGTACRRPRCAFLVDGRAGVELPWKLKENHMKSIMLATMLLCVSSGAVLATTQPHTTGKINLFSAVASPAATNPIAGIQQITETDLTAAIADAQAHNDTRHLPCWQALLPVVQANSLPVHLPTAPGLAELAQTYFDAKNGIQGIQTTLDPVVTACALTLADLQMGFMQLVTAIGLKVALPALPAGL